MLLGRGEVNPEKFPVFPNESVNNLRRLRSVHVSLLKMFELAVKLKKRDKVGEDVIKARLQLFINKIQATFFPRTVIFVVAYQPGVIKVGKYTGFITELCRRHFFRARVN